MGKDHFTTRPPIVPELPPTVMDSEGEVWSTRMALPITRAVLMAAIEALKQVPGGAKRTQYSLERACFHLKRVKVKTFNQG